MFLFVDTYSSPPCISSMLLYPFDLISTVGHTDKSLKINLAIEASISFLNLYSSHTLICLSSGRAVPERYDLKKARASLGLKRGTAWPAPLKVAKVNPSYS